jgi:hypothetical protein
MVVILSISLIFSLGGACSKEEQQEVQKPQEIVRVKIPLQQPPAREEAKIEPEETLSEATETAAPEEIQLSISPQAEVPEKEEIKKVDDGYYKVKKGETLFRVAGREDVYGDPMKWPSLFRLNMNLLGGIKVAEAFELEWSRLFELTTDRLGGIKVLEDFQHERLPEGLELRFITEPEAKQNLSTLDPDVWVVNIISSQDSKRIVPPAIILMKNGYRVYIANAEVKGKEWMRLRVGFFKDRPKAAAAGKEIMSILKASDIWVTKTEKNELEEFGGY